MLRLVVLPALVGLSLAAPVKKSHTVQGVIKEYIYDYDDPEDVPGVVAAAFPAHISDEGRRVDVCLNGMVDNVTVASTRIPGAAANNSKAADKMIADFIQRASKAAPQCYANTGNTPFISPDSGIVSEDYKLYFQTAAKVGSQMAEAYMKCRFNGQRGPKADDDYTRFMFVRNPAGRAISGYFQMVGHYMYLLKMPPKMVNECAEAFPKEARWPNDTAGRFHWPINSYVASAAPDNEGKPCSIRNHTALSEDDHLGPIVDSKFPEQCLQTWGHMFDHAKPDGELTIDQIHNDQHESPEQIAAFERAKYQKQPFCAVEGLSYNMTKNTADSALYKKMWTLPARCRFPLNNTIMATATDHIAMYSKMNMTFKEILALERLPDWMCPEGEDCDKPCEVNDHEFAELFAAGLSDAARMRNPGCSGELFSGEHMWSEYTHLAAIGRVDAMLRLEDIEGDVKRFEQVIEKQTGTKLPEPQEGCKIEELAFINNAQDEHSEVVQIPWHDTDRLKDVLSRSADLQRRVCALYYHDFVCLGYELLEACKAPAEEWLDQALDDLVHNAPIKKLAPQSLAQLDIGHMKFAKPASML